MGESKLGVKSAKPLWKRRYRPEPGPVCRQKKATFLGESQMAGGFGDARDEPDHANKRGAEPLRSLHQRVGDEYMIRSISRSALSVSLPPLLLR